MFRWTWLAALVFVVCLTLGSRAPQLNTWDVWLVNVVAWTILAVIYIRVGLLSAMVGGVSMFWVITVPHTADFSEWYAAPGLVAISAVLLVACFGFYTSTLAPNLRLQPAAESSD